ncbi:SAM-dependent methyltransferase [Amycolatopsis sp.]|uniref:SAM-dependent methyltransferase n=1 Tax=Amycolatopsis sp. TaxID=37632 RepID=UPI002D12B0C5|nr:SAM-dependent methyltransferase [Amycolatopsis sp.]HVV13319.1 SAM-dependent methyltransferase [Amycolatopsis sp.]
MSEQAPEGVDLEHPNAARIYDYLLGGTANWAIDRSFGDLIVKHVPLARTIARVNREFLGRSVRYCVRNGVSQFLDLGSGVPTVGNVHEAADELDESSRCVYVDREPVAVAHSELLLEEHGDPARHAVVRADFRDVPAVWRQAAETGVLDTERPIGLILCAALHFLGPAEPVEQIMAAYRERLPSGSYLIITHGTKEELRLPPEQIEKISAVFELYEQSDNPVYSRSRAEITKFFGDFALVEPGVVWLPEWRPGDGPAQATAKFTENPSLSTGFCGVARKA